MIDETIVRDMVNAKEALGALVAEGASAGAVTPALDLFMATREAVIRAAKAPRPTPAPGTPHPECAPHADSLHLAAKDGWWMLTFLCPRDGFLNPIYQGAAPASENDALALVMREHHEIGLPRSA